MTHVTFRELLTEAQEPDFRTAEMINEAQENNRKWIDGAFMSVIKITGKVIDKLIDSQPRKQLVTTDGKWTITFVGLRGSNRGKVTFTFADSSKYYKNGQSPNYKIYGKFENVVPLIQHAFDTNSDATSAIKEIMKLGKEDTSMEISVSEKDEANKNKFKVNPYSLLNNIKPYSKAIPKNPSIENAKVRKDGIIKMLFSGQVSRVEVAYQYTDDYARDAETKASKGKELSPFEIMESLDGATDSFAYFKEGHDGIPYLNVVVYRGYSVKFILDLTKFKK